MTVEVFANVSIDVAGSILPGEKIVKDWEKASTKEPPISRVLSPNLGGQSKNRNVPFGSEDGHPSCPGVSTRVLRPTFPSRWAICPTTCCIRRAAAGLGLRPRFAYGERGRWWDGTFGLAPRRDCRVSRHPALRRGYSSLWLSLHSVGLMQGPPPKAEEIRPRLRRGAPRLSGYAARGARTFLPPP